MQFDVLQDGEKISIQIEWVGDQFEVQIGERRYQVRVERQRDGHLLLQIDGRSVAVVTAGDDHTRYVAVNGNVYRIPKHDARTHHSRRMGRTGSGGTPAASMPGQVVAVHVAEGDQVRQGQTLVVLEAMKMEVQITAPEDGTVRAVHYQVGQTVERGQVLVEVEGQGLDDKMTR